MWEKLEYDLYQEDIWWWLLWIGEKETDYKFWADVTMEILAWDDFNDRQPTVEYNQAAQYETRNYCTIYSAFTELSYLLDKEFTLEDILEVADSMIKDWKLDPDKWAYLSDAIDYVRKRHNNKFKDNVVVSYQIDYTDENLWDILVNKTTRLTQLWYRTSSELYQELESTWHASKSDYPKNWWHAVTCYWLNIIDNYKGRKKHNRYSFDKIQDLIKNWVIFSKWYVFLKI